MKKLAYVAILATCILCGCDDSKTKLYVYTWADYIDPEKIGRAHV